MSEIESYQRRIMECEEEIGKGIIGQKEIIRQVILALLSGGNVLLEGMPGLGKTMLVRTISQVFLLSFKRIQFTPDLMPSDVTGTNIMVKEEGKSSFRFERGRDQPGHSENPVGPVGGHAGAYSDGGNPVPLSGGALFGAGHPESH